MARLFKREDRSGSIEWAPRLAPGLLRRLYLLDVKGIQDESVLDEVGMTLLVRCEDIRRVSERRCWRCGGELEGEKVKGSRLKCVDCGWSTGWTTYRNSYKQRRVHGPRALPAVKAFLREYPRAQGWSSKMVTIDRLIYSVHESFGQGQDPKVVPLAENLIEGSPEDTFVLLESLATGDQGTAGLNEIKLAWTEKVWNYKRSRAEKRRKAEAARDRKKHNKRLREQLSP